MIGVPPLDWSNLGAVPPRELTEARLALHFAAQPMTAAAYAVLPMREDHSHTNFHWSDRFGGLLGRRLRSANRCFLYVTGMRIGLVTPQYEEVGNFELAGRTVEDALAAMADALRADGEDVPVAGLTLPDYDLPETAVARGEPFPELDPAALQELACWFRNATHALTRVAKSHLRGAEVVGWAHHFDLAALSPLDEGGDPEQARSLGVGMSPGDGSYDEPYFYVSPWPRPDSADLPALPPGMHWHTEGFTSAILPGSQLVEARSAGAQAAKADDALRSSVEVCLDLLGA